jgi:hypothetical protein
MGISDTIGLLFEMNGDPEHAITALRLLEEEITTKLGAALGVSQKSIKEYGDAGLAAVKDVAAIGGAATAVGGALFAAAERAAHFAEEIGHIAERSGATAEQVSTLRFEADRLNVSSEAVGRGLSFFARNLDIAATTGKGAAAPAFRELGIATEDSAGHVRSVSAVLPEVVEKLSRMEAGAAKTAATMALFGRGGAELIPMLNALGAQGFDAVTKQAAALGRVVHEQDVVSAREFLAAQRELTAEVNAFALALGREVMPWLIQVFIKLQNFPILLRIVGLELQAVRDKLLALPTAGLSLIHLHFVNKQLADSTKEMDDALTKALVKFQKEAEAAREATKALQDQSHAIHGSGLADNIREFLIPALDDEERALKRTAEALAHSTIAHMAHAAASGESFKKAAKESVGAIAEESGIKVIWEAAQGVAMLALNFFMPNPRYVASAEAHFAAAAIYGAIGGAAAAVSAGMGRVAGAGAGGGAGRGEYERGGYGAGGGWSPGQQGVAGTGLAPGAQGGGGGRLSVYVVGDESAFIADRINAADQAGHFMQVTSARRSAPAQG